MKLTHRRTNTSDDTEVVFPLLECWNPMTKIATIVAQQSQRRVLCRISLAVLRRKFRAVEEQPMQAVVDNRSAIESAAKKLIEKEAFEADGSIVIRIRDL